MTAQHPPISLDTRPRGVTSTTELNHRSWRLKEYCESQHCDLRTRCICNTASRGVSLESSFTPTLEVKADANSDRMVISCKSCQIPEP